MLETLLFIGVLTSSALPYDTSRLCDAIGYAETGNGKTAKEETNLWNMYHWQEGTRKLQAFATVELGKERCQTLWDRNYGRFPDLALAKRYTGDDNAEHWLRIVCHKYPHSKCTLDKLYVLE